MDFLISSAWAQSGQPQGGLMSFLPLILIFAVFYFMLIRPQMKRAKEHRQMVAALSKGDEVATNGGLLGKITHITDSIVTLQVSENVEIKLQRHAVASVMPKGTMSDS